MIVDCPMCGRDVRVPHADGRVEPLPRPELDLRDARLQEALDELALIGAGPLRKSASGHADALETEQLTGRASVAAPEPVPAPAAVPVRTGPTAEEEQSLTEALAHLTKLAPVQQPVSVTVEDEPARPWKWVVLSGLAAAMAFAAGFLAGRGAQPTEERTDVGSGHSTAAVADRGDVAKEDLAPAIRGRITWRTAEGDSRPDRGARVFVLPETYAGESRISVSALQSEPGSDSFKNALEELRVLGGNLAVVNDDGTFEAEVASAGVYTIIAISNYQPGAEGQEIDPGVQAVLERFFDRPARVLGGTQHRAAQLRYSGDGSVLWDHSFERS